MKRASLHIEETPSLLADGCVHTLSQFVERGVDSIVSHRTNNLFTCQLSTRQLYLITILNCEL